MTHDYVSKIVASMCGVLKEGERKNDKEISETRTLDGKERCVEIVHRWSQDLVLIGQSGRIWEK